IRSPISAGSARFLRSDRSIEPWRCSGVHSICHEESTPPGATALTRTSGARPRARFLVRFTSAALLAPYGIELPPEPVPAIEAVLTMAPRAAFSADAAALEQRNGPSRLVARIVAHNSSVTRSSRDISTVERTPGVPALLTRR